MVILDLMKVVFLSLKLNMIQLLYLCVFLSLAAKCADTSVTASLAMMTVSDYTHLTCCHPGQNISQCTFYIDSREIGQETGRNCCCELSVSGQQLLESKAEQQLLTAVNVRCLTQFDYGNNTSADITITVWRLSLSGKHAVILMLVLGALVLFSLLIFISVCIWYCMTKKQGRKGQFHPVKAQELDTDTQGVNHGIEEEQDDRSEVVGDELFYATVNHTSSGVTSAVKFESGTDYATVVVN